MLSQLKLKFGEKRDGSAARRKLPVTIAAGESLGLKYEWECGGGRLGPHVVAIEPGSAAARAGLKIGQVIYSVDGRRTEDHMSLVSCIHNMRAAGGSHTIEVCAASASASPTTSASTSLGASLASLATRRRAGSGKKSKEGGEGGSFPKALTRPLLKSAEASLKTAAQPMPAMYEVVCPSQPDVEGTYTILRGDESCGDADALTTSDLRRVNGAAVWASAGGKRLYCTRSGLWALVDCQEGPERNIALVSSRRQGRGRAPHSMHWAEWQCWDGGAWLACPVRIEELRIDPVDGKPYWRGAFNEYYGEDAGPAKWKEAAAANNVWEASSGEDLDKTVSALSSSVAGLTEASSSLDTRSCSDSSDILSCYSEMQVVSRRNSTYEPPSLSMLMTQA